MSWRLMKQISYLLKDAPASSVSKLLNISDSSVLRADKEILNALDRACPEDLSNRHHLIIDEKYLGKKLQFMTCVIDHRGEVLYTALGKSKDVLDAFFEQMTDDQLECIEAVSIDRSNSYKDSLRQHVPHARICFDPFHIISNVNDAVDEVRRDAWRQAQAKDKSYIKGTRFLLLKSRENISENKQVELNEALESNKPINKAYWLKEQLRFIYKLRDEATVSVLLDQWLIMAEKSELKPFEMVS